MFEVTWCVRREGGRAMFQRQPRLLLERRLVPERCAVERRLQRRDITMVCWEETFWSPIV